MPDALQSPKPNATRAIPDTAVAPTTTPTVAVHAAAARTAIPVRTRLGTAGAPGRHKTATAPSVDAVAIQKYRTSVRVAISLMTAKTKGTSARSNPSARAQILIVDI